MRNLGGELVLAGSKEGFDLLPHIRSGAIALGSHQCKKEKKIKPPLGNQMEIWLNSPGLPRAPRCPGIPPDFPDGAGEQSPALPGSHP